MSAQFNPWRSKTIPVELRLDLTMGIVTVTASACCDYDGYWEIDVVDVKDASGAEVNWDAFLEAYCLDYDCAPGEVEPRINERIAELASEAVGEEMEERYGL